MELSSILPIVRIISLIIFFAGIILNIAKWVAQHPSKPSFMHNPDKKSQIKSKASHISIGRRVLIILKIFVLYAVLNALVFKRSKIRWIMHIFIFFGILFLLFHACTRVLYLPSLFGVESDETYILIHNSVSLILLVGIIIALTRRIFLKEMRKITGLVDLLPIVLLLGVVSTGYILTNSELLNIAILGLKLPLPSWEAYVYVYQLHFIIVYVGIAYLPFSKLLHILAVPVSMVARAAKEKFILPENKFNAVNFKFIHRAESLTTLISMNNETNIIKTKTQSEKD